MGGSSKQPQVKQETHAEMSPEQRAIFGEAFPYAQKYASQPLQQYGGTGLRASGRKSYRLSK